MPQSTRSGFEAFTGRLTVALLAVLGLVVVVAVVSTQSTPAVADGPVPVDDREPVAIPLAPSAITGVEASSIGIRTTDVTDLGLRDDNSLDVPDDAETVGWYDRSASPGTVGPTVLAGHVNFSGAKGTFFDLKDMKKDDTVEVHREDGTTAVFRVDEVNQYPKDSFPTSTVYGATSDPEIRLITCGGVFDAAKHSYDDNIVVSGTLVDAYRAKDA